MKEEQHKRYEDFLRRSVLDKQFPLWWGSKYRQIVAIMEEKKARLTRQYVPRPQEPLVSIIMPTFNRMHMIPRAIRSVRAQLYKNWELLIVDDGGTDDTQSVVERYQDARIRYHRLPDNRGPRAARNQGMRIASGRYFAYLDSDNTWEPEYLLLMVNTLVDRPGFLSLYAAQRIRKFRGLRNFLRFGVFHRALLENRNYIDLNIFLHHRDLYHRYGGFDEAIQRVADWDLILRYTQKHFPFALDCILGTYYASWDFTRISKSEDLHANLMVVYNKLNTKPLRLSHLPSVSPAANCRFFSNMSSREGRNEKAPAQVSIIIPSYEALDCLKTCIEAIQTYTDPKNYELIIVDNGSARPVVLYLKSLQAQHQANVIFNASNLGFAHAANQGLALAAPHRDVVIMNNEAIVTEQWLEALSEVKDDIADAGIIAPRQVLPPFSKTMKLHASFCLEEGELDVNLSRYYDNVYNSRLWPEKGYVELTFAPFFCVYITRSCLERVGPLDHEHGGDDAPDRLYCEQARKQHHYRIVYTPHAKVYRVRQRSTPALPKANPTISWTICSKNRWESLPDQEESRCATPVGQSPSCSWRQ